MTVDSTAARTSAMEVLAPMDGASAGRLILDRGTPDLEVSSDRTLTDLARAHFEGLRPRVNATDGQIVVTYPGGGLLGWLRYAFQPARGSIVLNGGVPWALDFRDGVQRISADLRQIMVTGVRIGAGVGRAELWLPSPAGTVPISFGSVGSLHLHRPAGAPLRVSIRGGISSLHLDGEELGGIGGGIHRETPGWATAPDRFDVSVRGGVTHIAITD
jgi:hypothetical protein